MRTHHEYQFHDVDVSEEGPLWADSGAITNHFWLWLTGDPKIVIHLSRENLKLLVARLQYLLSIDDVNPRMDQAIMDDEVSS